MIFKKPELSGLRAEKRKRMDAKYESYIKHNKLSKEDTELELKKTLDFDSFKEYSDSGIKVEAFKNDGSCYPKEAGRILFHVDDYAVCTLSELNNMFKPVYDESEDW